MCCGSGGRARDGACACARGGGGSHGSGAGAAGCGAVYEPPRVAYSCSGAARGGERATRRTRQATRGTRCTGSAPETDSASARLSSASNASAAAAASASAARARAAPLQVRRERLASAPPRAHPRSRRATHLGAPGSCALGGGASPASSHSAVSSAGASPPCALSTLRTTGGSSAGNTAHKMSVPSFSAALHRGGALASTCVASAAADARLAGLTYDMAAPYDAMRSAMRPRSTTEGAQR